MKIFEKLYLNKILMLTKIYNHQDLVWVFIPKIKMKFLKNCFKIIKN